MADILPFKGAPRAPEPGPPPGFRKAIPLLVKLQVLLTQGHVLDENDERVEHVEDLTWDHCPPLQLRRFDFKAWDTIPPANDPFYIIARAKAPHERKTREIDIPQIAKTKRLTDEQRAFRNRILEKTSDELKDDGSGLDEDTGLRPRERHKRKIPSRPFRKSDKQKAREKRRKQREPFLLVVATNGHEEKHED